MIYQAEVGINKSRSELLLRTTLCLFSILIIPGCYPRVDCPAYPDASLSWLPYKNGQTYYFTNGTDTVKLKISDFYIANAYRDIKYPHDPPCSEVNAFPTISTPVSLFC
jgi:hypothetical protein